MNKPCLFSSGLFRPDNFQLNQGGSQFECFPNSEESTAGFASSNSERNATKSQFWQVTTLSGTGRCSRSWAYEWFGWFGIRGIPCFYFSVVCLGYVGGIFADTNGLPVFCRGSAEKDHTAAYNASPLGGKETFWELRLAALFTQRGTWDVTSPGNKIKGLPQLILGFVISPAHHCASWLAPDCCCSAGVCKERCYHPLSAEARNRQYQKSLSCPISSSALQTQEVQIVWTYFR